MDHPAARRRPAWREFEAFYRDQFGVAWRALARLGVPLRDCEDAAQEVFVTAHRRWSTVREPQRRRAWLLGIARRIAWRHRRGDDRRARRLEMVAAVALPAMPLEQELQRREAWRAVVEFLDGLDDDKREAFVLGELEELPRPELAAALGVQPSTAYSRLQAARRLFVEHFAALDDDACARMLTHGVPEDPDARTIARGWTAIAPLVAVKLPASVATSLLVKVVAATAIAGGTVAVVSNRASDPPTVATAATQPIRAERVEPSVPPAIPPLVQPSAPSSLPPVAPIVAPAKPTPRRAIPTPPTIAADDPRAAEVALLSSAREAAIAGDVAGARRKLDEHRRRFGDDGSLVALRRDLERSLDDVAIVSSSASGDNHSQEP
ncbi:MAG TPA: sigma-70 family RNA polymerase sigma factor [Nannocystaceae bacterium]|nr:sigma-70 family RNA polymerase sigma factor [Nannocystaceae bacterium]